MTDSEQLRLLPEGAHESGPALHGAQVVSCPNGKITEPLSAVIGHGVVFEIAPDTFDRVHLGCIGGQELKGDMSPLRFDVLAHEDEAMRLQAVPNDQQLLADRRLQYLEEFKSTTWCKAR
jgi:hypothetical protein